MIFTNTIGDDYIVVSRCFVYNKITYFVLGKDNQLN